MKYRIEFIEPSVFMGNMVDRKYSTKWMTKEEVEVSEYLHKDNATVIGKENNNGR